MGENRPVDTHLLDAYDEQLYGSGSYLFQQRTAFLNQMLPLAKEFYISISGMDEGLEIEYESQLSHSSFQELLQEFRQKDILFQRTLAGVHKDEIQIRFNGLPFKFLASQGQRKSLLFALKLAAFELLKRNKGFSPILLLDDVFEKLDTFRMNHLLEWVCLQNQGQIFITDTDRSRIAQQMQGLALSHQLIEL
jgi:DNA replication and repair protein RecF